MKVTAHTLRQAGAADQAIVDYFQLLYLHDTPVRLRVKYLMDLWHCSQPQVSRRMNAINRLVCCRVESGWGFYRLSLDAPLPPPVRVRRGWGFKAIRRRRWEQLRQQWQEVAA